eukprot:2464322-Alexandrium_andersonii.AAC.1
MRRAATRACAAQTPSPANAAACAPSHHFAMDATGRALLDDVNAAVQSMQAAIDNSTPCSPSLR